MLDSSVVQELTDKPVSTNKPPPYHIFTVLGDYFVFDTSTQMLYGIDQVTYCFLEECLKHTILEATEILLARGKFSKKLIQSVSKEVTMLAEHGLFDVPDYRKSKKSTEEALEKRSSQTITSIALGITESCNLDCVYCYCSNRCNLSSKIMSKDVARKAIDWLFKFSKKKEQLSLIFFGGEPLVNKNIIYFAVEYSQALAQKYKKKVRYSVTTNATLIDEEFAVFMKKYKFSTLVSLDGPQDIHDNQCPTRNGQGSFELATAGAKRVIDYQEQTMARCTMIKPVPRVKELIKFFKDFGFTSCYLGPSVNTEETSTSFDFDDNDHLDFDLQNEELIPEILDEISCGKTPFYDPYDKFVKYYENRRTTNIFPSNCGAASEGCIYINVDGTIYPCHHYYGYEAWEMGNIFDDKPLDVESQKEYWRKFRKSTKACESCWAGVLCQGPCSALQFKIDGAFSDNIRYCDSRRFVLERAGYIFYKKQFFKEHQNKFEMKKCLE